MCLEVNGGWFEHLRRGRDRNNNVQDGGEEVEGTGEVSDSTEDGSVEDSDYVDENEN